MSKMLESKQWEHNCKGKAINGGTHLGHVDCAGAICALCECEHLYGCYKSKVS